VDAYQYAYAGLPVCPVYRASRNDIFTAIFQCKRGIWRKTLDEQILTTESLISQITVKTLFCGEYVSENCRSTEAGAWGEGYNSPAGKTTKCALSCNAW